VAGNYDKFFITKRQKKSILATRKRYPVMLNIVIVSRACEKGPKSEVARFEYF
jgi:hypothetical protein